jgi:hypothetical protein
MSSAPSQRRWIPSHSDHALVYFEVQR